MIVSIEGDNNAEVMRDVMRYRKVINWAELSSLYKQHKGMR